MGGNSGAIRSREAIDAERGCRNEHKIFAKGVFLNFYNNCRHKG
jgi:hypothetical protein